MHLIFITANSYLYFLCARHDRIDSDFVDEYIEEQGHS